MRAIVIRNSEEEEVLARELVIGDIDEVLLVRIEHLGLPVVTDKPDISRYDGALLNDSSGCITYCL
jgi:hypothetical protein